MFKEADEHAKALGMTRVALSTDQTLVSLPYVAQVRDALKAAGLENVVAASGLHMLSHALESYTGLSPSARHRADHPWGR